MSKKNKMTIVISLCIIILLCLNFLVHFLSNNKKTVQQIETKPAPLTEAQKVEIIKEVSAKAEKTKPVTVDEQTKLLKQVTTEFATFPKEKPLTDAEKNAIMNATTQ